MEKKNSPIKILCHTCEGTKTVTEIEYKTRKEIKVPCPECNGKGWVWT